MLMLLLFAALVTGYHLGDQYETNNKRFPEDFMFGVATSAYQVEGAWNVDGRSPSVWDNMTHENPEFTPDRSNGDDACLSYYKYKEDVQIMKAMGVKHYRFSISWSRVLPTGNISIVLDTAAYVPASDSEEDKIAADTKFHFELGWYANPVHFGDYPDIMKTRVAERSRGEGRNQSRLPEFTEEEKALLRGTADFFAVNVYTANLINHIDDPPISNPPSKWQDIGVNDFQPSEWDNSTQPSWFKIAPWTIRNLLNWIKNHYENPEIIITENGLCTDDDNKRINYIRVCIRISSNPVDRNFY
ncbi:unnamed protein product [Diabrotica balteata]|uniref:beta-glucosidase n=1 Tax=Diabrotica balteata TaxID=107213 RepID=A0A9N9SRT4_DIABA|nr:unnamed protein product [Diabrotica balteata]